MENMEQQPKKGGMWGWIVLAVVVVLVIAYAVTNKGGTSNSAPAATGPIMIGGIAPLSGDADTYGIPDQQAKDLAVAEINAAGGINGRPLQMIWEDSKCDGTDATTAVQKLINVDQVQYILGGSCSGETLAAAPLTQAARVLLFTALSSSPDITNAGDLVFRTYPSDAFAGKVMAGYASNTLNAKTAAIISENTDYAQALTKVFAADFTGKVVDTETYNTGTTDFRTILAKVKAANPDVIYLIPQTITPAELLLQQIHDLGLKSTILGDDPMLDRTELAKNPALFEGVIVDEVAPDATNPKTAAFFAAYQAKYGTPPEFPGYLAASYDSVYLLADAMKAGNMTPDSIANYFNTQIHDWQGALGTFNFDVNGDAIIPIHLRKIVNGQVTDLGTFSQ